MLIHLHRLRLNAGYLEGLLDERGGTFLSISGATPTSSDVSLNSSIKFVLVASLFEVRGFFNRKDI